MEFFYYSNIVDYTKCVWCLDCAIPVRNDEKWTENQWKNKKSCDLWILIYMERAMCNWYPCWLESMDCKWNRFALFRFSTIDNGPNNESTRIEILSIINTGDENKTHKKKKLEKNNLTLDWFVRCSACCVRYRCVVLFLFLFSRNRMQIESFNEALNKDNRLKELKQSVANWIWKWKADKLKKKKNQEKWLAKIGFRASFRVLIVFRLNWMRFSVRLNDLLSSCFCHCLL